MRISFVSVLVLQLAFVSVGSKSFGQQRSGARNRTGSSSDDKSMKDLARLKRDILAGSAPLDQNNVASLTSWYGSRFGSMARTRPDGTQPDCAGLRRELLADLYGRRTRSDEARSFVTNYVLSKWAPVSASASLHPGFKVNYLLLIGDLNDVPGGSGSTRTPPVPSRAARRILLDEFENPKQIDAVKVAALVGLLRHVELEMVNQNGRRLANDNEAGANRIIKDMMELIAAEQPPAGRSLAGHHWMQRRAIEILAALGGQAPVSELAAELDKKLRNAAAPISLRCTAADTFGRLTLNGQPSFNPAETANGLVTLAINACQAESRRLQKWEDQNADNESGVGGFAREGEARRVYSEGELNGEAAENPEQKVVTAARRRLKYQLACAQTGLTGHNRQGGASALLQQDADRSFVDQVVSTLANILQSLDQTDLKPDMLKQALESNTSRLEQLLTRAGGKAPPPTEPAEAPQPQQPAQPDWGDIFSG